MCYVQSACRQVYRNTVDLNVSLVHPYWPLKKCSCGLLCWALRTDTGLFSCTNLTGLVIFRILSACVVNLAWDEVYARSFLSMWNWRVLNVTRDEILCNKFSAHASPVLHIAASSVQHAINAWRDGGFVSNFQSIDMIDWSYHSDKFGTDFLSLDITNWHIQAEFSFISVCVNGSCSLENILLCRGT